MSIFATLTPSLKRNSTAAAYPRIVSAWLRAMLLRLSPELFVKRRYKKMVGRPLDLDHAETFDEKLLWLMLNWRHPLKSQCGDKYSMRAYVTERGWERILPPLAGVYEKSSDIDFDALPEKFVLKCTHGWGFNIICKNKAKLDRNDARRTLDEWMAADMSTYFGELHYASMTHRIICEHYLDDLSGDDPADYKLYCFGGRVHCTLVCQQRSALQGHPLSDFYDRSWTSKLPYSRSCPVGDRTVPKPRAYDEMLRAAEELSKPFPFVRMDFYDIHGRAVLGEMTFTPNACIDPDYPDDAQRELGSLIVLPARLPS